jgi:Skp family chaperone for outer membrane proteins
VNRVFVYLSALVGLGGMLFLAGQGVAQGPASPAPKPAGRTPVAVFNVMKVLKDYQKFQAFVKTMTDKRAAAMGPMSTLRATILKLQDDLSKESVAAKRDELTKTLVAKQREFEDQERQITAALDGESAQYLRTVYVEIQQCVKAIVDANGYDLVLAYPDAVDPKEMENPLYFNAKLRSQAAMPFYVAPQADMTEVLILTLNRNFPATVVQAGAAQPAAPQQPGK